MDSRPRLGFLGVGWIGRHRLSSIIEHGNAEIVAIADPNPGNLDAAIGEAPSAMRCENLGQLLERSLDGVVIATPSGLHAEHCVTALSRGVAVFCQKPLARSAAEARRVVDAARAADRLIGLDLSYRHTRAVRELRKVVRSGELGRIFAIDLVFHNAYGPDAAWFYDKVASGGGCVIDLGVHLVDLALWLLDFPPVLAVDSQLFAKGEPLVEGSQVVEDYASVQLQCGDGVVLRLTCSWRISAGRDAVFQVALYGSDGGAAMKNVGGSFYDFVAERYDGPTKQVLASPPDPWGGRAATGWVEQLARSRSFDPEARDFVEVARVIDAIYAGAGGHAHYGELVTPASAREVCV
ncbi:Gfo/Idh/MocA family oxidoreductase [soil metagenome]